MDSQRWQQERQPGEGRGGSHSPHVRTTKVSRGPDASLVAYQDSRTHAARQHWGPTKPYEHAAAEAAYEPPSRASTSSRATYASSSTGGYAGSDSSHNYTTSSAVPYGSSHAGYQPSSVSATPRNPPADPYTSAYQQPSSSRDYPAQGYPSYAAQSSTDPYGRPVATSTYAANPSQYATTSSQYATPRYFGYYDDEFLVYR